MKAEYEVDLHVFIQWLREHSYKVGYSRLIYLYSADGVEAKQFLNRLMYLDLTSEWGWIDDYVEYSSAQCFPSYIEVFRKGIRDGVGVKLEPYSSSDQALKQHGPFLPFVKLVLFDVQELAGDAQELQAVFDVCLTLAQRKAFVILTGDEYPSEVFKTKPHIARFLLDGYVIRIVGDRIVFEGDRPIRSFDMPFYGLLDYGIKSNGEKVPAFAISDCEELLFQWDVLCDWKTRRDLFDYDLFKEAFLGAWSFFMTKVSREDYPQYSYVRARLMGLMGGFIGGCLDTGFRLFTDNGFSLEEIAFGDPCELAASKTFVSRLLYSCLEKKLYKMNGLLEVSQFMPQNEFELFHAKYWERRVSFVGFQESIDDLASELKEVHKCRCSESI